MTIFTTRLLIALSLFLTAPLSSAGDLVVGQVAPLSGVLATTGQQMVLGARLYFDAINDKGGVNGARIRHVVLDDAYRVEETVRQTSRLIEKEKPVALLGFAGTANVGELLRQGILEKAGIALVAPYTGGGPLREPFNRHLFHIRASYADEASHMVDQLTTLGSRRIAVFFQEDAFGRSGLAGVESALQLHGLKPVVIAGYERNTVNVDAAVQKILAAAPGAVIMVSVNKTTAAFAKAFRAAAGTAQLINISVVDSDELVKLAGLDAVHGLGITQVVPFPYSGVTPIHREYHQALRKYAPPGTLPSYASFEEFIGAKVLVEALRRAGTNPSAQKVMQALESLGQFDSGGFLVNFSRDNHAGSKFVEISIIGRHGKLLR